MKVIINHLFILVWFQINVKCFEFLNHTSEIDTGIAGHNQNDTYIVLPKFPLYKCHCEANRIWQNGKCIAMQTGVEFVLEYSPFLTKEINTGDFEDVIVGSPECNSTMDSVAIQNVAFTKNDTLFHWETGDNFRDLYCVEHVKNGKGMVVLQAHVCTASLCIPVCCPPGEFLDHKTYNCYKAPFSTALFRPPVNVDSGEDNTTNITPYNHPIPKCKLQALSVKELNIKKGGTLQYQQSHIYFFEWDESPMESIPLITKHPEDYCVAMEMKKGEIVYSTVYWDEFAPLACKNVSTPNDEYSDQCDHIMRWILLPLVALSAFFLFIILGLHFAMVELQKSIGSKITMCHVASLFCGFCLLLGTPSVDTPLTCKIFGPLVQVTFLATFFWLNVMCFDIWWKLRCRSPAGETRQSAHVQFVWYSIYAWGSPLVIGGITVIMDNLPDIQGSQEVIVPGFGKNHCWFADRKATFAYYFGVISVLMVMNALFFGWVFFILTKANCTYGKILKNNKRNNRRLWIYLKIFGVMGITWVCELLSWQEGTCKYWIVTDIINALRGPILFAIFFGNKKSINKIRQRFSSMNQSFHTQWSRSVNSLRKLNLKSNSTTNETGLNSRRSSETHAELSNRTHKQDAGHG